MKITRAELLTLFRVIDYTAALDRVHTQQYVPIIEGIRTRECIENFVVEGQAAAAAALSCDACYGTGYQGYECPHCNGTGVHVE